MLVIVGLVVVVAAIILSLYHLHRFFGLSLLYVFIGSIQYLQTLMVSTVHVDFAGYPMSPGSVVLFSSTLFAVLLVYLREDVPSTRRLIYGVLLANLSLVSLTVLIRIGISSGSFVTHSEYVRAFDDFDLTLFGFGTFLLLADSLILLFVYEAVSLRFRRFPLFARVAFSLLLVLYFDAVLFTSVCFGSSPDYANMLIGNVIGKTVSGFMYASCLWAYLVYSHPARSRSSDFVPQDVTDVFSIVTYRERYRNLQSRSAKKELEHARQQRHTEEQLRQARHDLLHAQKMDSIGRLAGGIAHDFNNMLTAILGYSELILANQADPKRNSEFAGEIRAAALRAAKLTHQLLAFSRKQILTPQVLNANELIESIANMLRRLLGENVQLELNLSDAAPNVYVDGLQLQQVLVNLAINGRDAMPEGGTLCVDTSFVILQQKKVGDFFRIPAGKYLRIAFSDSGTGMDESTLSHVFEPFFTTKERGKGTGLGLAMVYGVIEQSGGGIFITSQIDHGSTFEIWLPATFNDAATDSDLERPSFEPMRGRILVVEDNASVAGVTKEFLQDIGFDVSVAYEAETALRLAATEGPIDLLLTDIVLPGIDGCELASRLVQLYPRIEVILMTGYVDDQTLRHVAGQTVIQKPYDSSDLIAQICEKLANRIHRVQQTD